MTIITDASRMTAWPIFAAWLLAAAALAPVAEAQSGPVPAADARTPVVPLAYQSPFAGYRPFSDDSVSPWREVNDLVGRIGGWKAYAREAYDASKREKAGASGMPPAAEWPATAVPAAR